MTKLQKLDASRVEITDSISADIFESYRKKAISNINNEISIDGFRKGKIPESILIAKVGEMTILEEMAELAISEAYPKIITDEKIDAIGRPEVNITKIAAHNPLEFKIVTAVVPEINLGNYKKAVQEVKREEPTPVTEKDVEDALLRIRRSRVDHSGHAHDEKMTEEEHNKLIDASLPEVTDEFAKSLGDFKNVADLKEKLREMIASDKIERQKEKTRISISDRLLELVQINLPQILIDSELHRIEAQFKDDIERMGVKLEDYLKHAQRTIEDLRKDWRPSAEKKAKLQLILNKIAVEEKIVVDRKDIDTEVDHIVAHYKDADRERAAIYAETILTNEKVFQLLEGLK